MSSSPPRFRVVTDDAPRPRRPRGPGPAVLLVGLYAALFMGSLFFLKARARSSGASRSGDAAAWGAATSPPPSRAALLEASGLSPASRSEYFHRLSSDCCSCGCDLNLRDCLVSDEACVRSPAIAAALLRELE
ncbi:MAG: hypothetical protein ABR576_14950 [Thermoanaerobaculia bacterium]